MFPLCGGGGWGRHPLRRKCLKEQNREAIPGWAAAAAPGSRLGQDGARQRPVPLEAPSESRGDRESARAASPHSGEQISHPSVGLRFLLPGTENKETGQEVTIVIIGATMDGLSSVLSGTPQSHLIPRFCSESSPPVEAGKLRPREFQ